MVNRANLALGDAMLAARAQRFNNSEKNGKKGLSVNVNNAITQMMTRLNRSDFGYVNSVKNGNKLIVKFNNNLIDRNLNKILNTIGGGNGITVTRLPSSSEVTVRIPINYLNKSIIPNAKERSKGVWWQSIGDQVENDYKGVFHTVMESYDQTISNEDRKRLMTYLKIFKVPYIIKYFSARMVDLKK